MKKQPNSGPRCDGRRIARLRRSFKLSQSDFALLVGVHPMTVSKWERGVLAPTENQRALLAEFLVACLRNARVGKTALGFYYERGYAYALYYILDIAFRW